MPPDIVVIIVRDTAGRFFVHQRRGDKETFPHRFGLGAGGRIEPGEAPAAAAVRELREETGLTAACDEVSRPHERSGTARRAATRARRSEPVEKRRSAAIRPLFDFDYRDGGTAYRLHVYETIVPPQAIPNDDGEWQWSGWLSAGELDALLAAGKLCPDTAIVCDRYMRSDSSTIVENEGDRR